MKNHFDLILKGGTALLPHPQKPWCLVEECVDIGISGGVITRINSSIRASGLSTFNSQGLYILPGLIDTQVHFREPGGEHKEDIESGSRAALLGGISAFLEMPNTHPPTVTPSALADKLKRASARSYCDYGFFFGAQPENVCQLPEWVNSHSGTSGVKVFMGSSTGSLLLNREEDLSSVLKNVKRPVAIHSEDEARLKERKTIALSHPGKVSMHPVWRDPECALLSTKRALRLAKKHGRRVHILHVTTEEEMAFLAQHPSFATVEVTPQHLSLSAEECYERLGTLAQMNPPIREQRHQKALWEGIRSGVVTMLGSDHAPHTLEEKQKLYPASPAGMPGVQTMLPLMLDHVHRGRLSLKQLTKLLATNPHRFYGIERRGLLKEGFLANISIVDLKKKRKITKKWLASKCGWSPFENQEVTGWPVAVLLRGKWAMREDEIISSPIGQAISFKIM